MSKSRVHVIKRDTGWAVKSEGAAKAFRVYNRKDEAVSSARKMSKGSDVIVHRKDGTIQKWNKSKK